VQAFSLLSDVQLTLDEDQGSRNALRHSQSHYLRRCTMNSCQALYIPNAIKSTKVTVPPISALAILTLVRRSKKRFMVHLPRIPREPDWLLPFDRTRVSGIQANEKFRLREPLISDLTRYGTSTYMAITSSQSPSVTRYLVTWKVLPM